LVILKKEYFRKGARQAKDKYWKQALSSTADSKGMVPVRNVDKVEVGFEPVF